MAIAGLCEKRLCGKAEIEYVLSYIALLNEKNSGNLYQERI